MALPPVALTVAVSLAMATVPLAAKKSEPTPVMAQAAAVVPPCSNSPVVPGTVELDGNDEAGDPSTSAVARIEKPLVMPSVLARTTAPSTLAVTVAVTSASETEAPTASPAPTATPKVKAFASGVSVAWTVRPPTGAMMVEAPMTLASTVELSVAVVAAPAPASPPAAPASA